MKVLLVDDSRVMRKIQKKALEALGDVQFTEAGDGLEALSAIADNSSPFHLILIDWNMPNMDGFTLVGRIRSMDTKTPLLMVTTESEKERIIQAIEAGANSYTLKPFTPDMLLQKVKQTLDIAA